MKRLKEKYLFIIACLLLTAMTVAIYHKISRRIIENALYPGHWDEPYLTSPAANILKNNDYNPHRFLYPAIPIYITAAGMALGYLSDASYGNFYDAKNLGDYKFPVYERRMPIQAAKLIFFGIGIATALLVCAIVYTLSGSLVPCLFAIPLCLCSTTLVYQMTQYINVDIVATFFSLFALFYLLKLDQCKYSGSFLWSILVPALLCACTLSSKYNYIFIIIPFIYYYIYTQKLKLEKAMLFLAIIFTSFLAFNPYVLLDVRQFLSDMAYQILSYKGGRPGFESNPGLDQLAYYFGSIPTEFSRGIAVFALGGVVLSLREKRRSLCYICLFLVPYSILLSSQRVHYTRNFLPVYAFVVVYSCIFLNYLLKYISANTFLPKAWKTVATVALIFFWLTCFDREAISRSIAFYRDTRNIALDVILNNISDDTPLYIAKNIGVPNDLLANHHTHEISSEDFEDWDNAFEKIPHGAYLILPRYDIFRNDISTKRSLEAINARINDSTISKIMTLSGSAYYIDLGDKAVPGISPEINFYYKN
jgi:hypothetical protein